MNLVHIAYELQTLKKDLELKGVSSTSGNVQINDWMRVSNSLNRLLDYSFLRDEVMAIFNIDEIINIRNDQWLTRESIYRQLNFKIDGLKETVNACIKLINEQANENSEIPEGCALINTKMPEKLDISKIASICNDLDKAFNQCPLINDEIKFIGVEKGSVIFVFTATIAAVTILGKILNVALDVQKKHYQNQMFKNKLETMGNITDSVSLIIKQLDSEVKEYCRAKTVEIEESKSLSSEDIERLALTIKNISVLIGQGVQMQCILDESQENIDVNFPKPEEYQSLIEGIKMLS